MKLKSNNGSETNIRCSPSSFTFTYSNQTILKSLNLKIFGSPDLFELFVLFVVSPKYL